jgi:hypothetical protein
LKNGARLPGNNGIVINVGTGSGNMIEDDLKTIKLALLILLEKEYEFEKHRVIEQFRYSRFRTFELRKHTISMALQDVDCKYLPLLKDLKKL